MQVRTGGFKLDPAPSGSQAHQGMDHRTARGRGATGFVPAAIPPSHSSNGGGASSPGNSNKPAAVDSSDARSAQATERYGSRSDQIVLGFIPGDLMGRLSDRASLQDRGGAIQELSSLVDNLTDPAVMRPYLSPLFHVLAGLLSEHSMIAVHAIELLRTCVAVCGEWSVPQLGVVTPPLLDKLGDNKIAVRQAAQRAVGDLIRIFGPQPILPSLLAVLAKRNRHARESILKLVILILLSVPSDSVDALLLVKAVTPMLKDASGRVRAIAREALAVIQDIAGDDLDVLNVLRSATSPSSRASEHGVSIVGGHVKTVGDSGGVDTSEVDALAARLQDSSIPLPTVDGGLVVVAPQILEAVGSSASTVISNISRPADRAVGHPHPSPNAPFTPATEPLKRPKSMWDEASPAPVTQSHDRPAWLQPTPTDSSGPGATPDSAAAPGIPQPLPSSRAGLHKRLPFDIPRTGSAGLHRTPAVRHPGADGSVSAAAVGPASGRHTVAGERPREVTLDMEDSGSDDAYTSEVDSPHVSPPIRSRRSSTGSASESIYDSGVQFIASGARRRAQSTVHFGGVAQECAGQQSAPIAESPSKGHRRAQTEGHIDESSFPDPITLPEDGAGSSKRRAWRASPARSPGAALRTPGEPQTSSPEITMDEVNAGGRNRPVLAREVSSSLSPPHQGRFRIPGDGSDPSVPTMEQHRLRAQGTPLALESVASVPDNTSSPSFHYPSGDGHSNGTGLERKQSMTPPVTSATPRSAKQRRSNLAPASVQSLPVSRIRDGSGANSASPHLSRGGMHNGAHGAEYVPTKHTAAERRQAAAILNGTTPRPASLPGHGIQQSPGRPPRQMIAHSGARWDDSSPITLNPRATSAQSHGNGGVSNAIAGLNIAIGSEESQEQTSEAESDYHPADYMSGDDEDEDEESVLDEVESDAGMEIQDDDADQSFGGGAFELSTTTLQVGQAAAQAAHRSKQQHKDRATSALVTKHDALARRKSRRKVQHRAMGSTSVVPGLLGSSTKGSLTSTVATEDGVPELLGSDTGTDSEADALPTRFGQTGASVHQRLAKRRITSAAPRVMRGSTDSTETIRQGRQVRQLLRAGGGGAVTATNGGVGPASTSNSRSKGLKALDDIGMGFNADIDGTEVFSPSRDGAASSKSTSQKPRATHGWSDDEGSDSDTAEDNRPVVTGRRAVDGSTKPPEAKRTPMGLDLSGVQSVPSDSGRSPRTSARGSARSKVAGGGFAMNGPGTLSTARIRTQSTIDEGVELSISGVGRQRAGSGVSGSSGAPTTPQSSADNSKSFFKAQQTPPVHPGRVAAQTQRLSAQDHDDSDHGGSVPITVNYNVPSTTQSKPVVRHRLGSLPPESDQRKRNTRFMQSAQKYSSSAEPVVQSPSYATRAATQASIAEEDAFELARTARAGDTTPSEGSGALSLSPNRHQYFDPNATDPFKDIPGAYPDGGGGGGGGGSDRGSPNEGSNASSTDMPTSPRGDGSAPGGLSRNAQISRATARRRERLRAARMARSRQQSRGGTESSLWEGAVSPMMPDAQASPTARGPAPTPQPKGAALDWSISASAPGDGAVSGPAAPSSTHKPKAHPESTRSVTRAGSTRRRGTSASRAPRSATALSVRDEDKSANPYGGPSSAATPSTAGGFAFPPSGRPEAVGGIGSTGTENMYTASSDLVPLHRPEHVLRSLDTEIKSSDWEAQFGALDSLRSLAVHHPEVLVNEASLQSIVLATNVAVGSLRSSVSRNALMAYADLFKSIGKAMGPHCDNAAPVLLKRAADTNAFLVSEAEVALDVMIKRVPYSRVLGALINSCVSKNKSTRLQAISWCDRALAECGSKVVKFRDLPALWKTAASFLKEGNPTARAAARRMIVRMAGVGAFQESKLNRAVPDADMKAIRSVIQKGVSAADMALPPVGGTSVSGMRSVSPRR